MGYYAAGGYYEAGGFSFKKLGRFVGKIAHNPLIQGALSFIPGAGTLLSGMQILDQVGGASKKAAVAGSTHGTPGHNAYHGRGRRTRRSRRSRW
jgi:hypothetical protein